MKFWICRNQGMLLISIFYTSEKFQHQLDLKTLFFKILHTVPILNKLSLNKRPNSQSSKAMYIETQKIKAR